MILLQGEGVVKTVGGETALPAVGFGLHEGDILGSINRTGTGEKPHFYGSHWGHLHDEGW
jgi:hypothetical protein